jgi:hypothetical protein
MDLDNINDLHKIFYSLIKKIKNNNYKNIYNTLIKLENHNKLTNNIYNLLLLHILSNSIDIAYIDIFNIKYTNDEILNYYIEYFNLIYINSFELYNNYDNYKNKIIELYNKFINIKNNKIIDYIKNDIHNNYLIYMNDGYKKKFKIKFNFNFLLNYKLCKIDDKYNDLLNIDIINKLNLFEKVLINEQSDNDNDYTFSSYLYKYKNNQIINYKIIFNNLLRLSTEEQIIFINDNFNLLSYLIDKYILTDNDIKYINIIKIFIYYCINNNIYIKFNKYIDYIFKFINNRHINILYSKLIVEINKVNNNIRFIKYYGFEIKHIYNSECIICYEPYNNLLIMVYCNNCNNVIGHLSCCNKWFMKNKICPLCRFSK